MPPSEAEDLVGRAMIGLDKEEQSDGSGPIGRHAIRHLHQIASREVLEVALAACVDADPIRQRIGAAVLGQLGHTKVGFEAIYTEERYLALAGLLKAEREGAGDPDVLSETCIALGHLHDVRAIPALLGLKEHSDAVVRRGVVHGLSGDDSPAAINGLIALSSDIDEGVRDWATFGLAQHIDSDTPAIRAALHARLDDPCVDVRNEAIEGLAKRGDQSVLPFLEQELREGIALPLLDAVMALARPELCDALAAAAGGLVVEALHGPYDLTEAWKEAMKACGCQLPNQS